VSTLRSALDELRSEDLELASEEELGEGLVELERASRVLEAEQSRRLVEVERRGTWSVDGHLSVVSWVASRLRVGFARASQQVKLSRALRAMPVTSRALGEAEVSSEAVGLLVRAHQAAPEAFSDAEPMLVDAAVSQPARELRVAIAYWCQAADAAGAEERARRQFEGRHLHVSPPSRARSASTGRWTRSPDRASSRLSAPSRTSGPRMGRKTPGVPLSGVQMPWWSSAGATWIASTGPGLGGERPHVVVTVDLQSLEGRPGRRSELEDTGPITPETARRLACDAGVSRIITMGASEPLDVGRRTPVVPSGMRRALVLRDGGCRFPGCGRPRSWCDAHPIRHWADGGSTALENLVLLCRPHHRAVHEGFRVEMNGHGPVFSRADGSARAEDRAPP
jgi:Domain of unknown function (DUF222)